MTAIAPHSAHAVKRLFGAQALLLVVNGIASYLLTGLNFVFALPTLALAAVLWVVGLVAVAQMLVRSRGQLDGNQVLTAAVLSVGIPLAYWLVNDLTLA